MERELFFGMVVVMKVALIESGKVALGRRHPDAC